MFVDCDAIFEKMSYEDRELLIARIQVVIDQAFRKEAYRIIDFCFFFESVDIAVEFMLLMQPFLEELGFGNHK